MALPISAKVLLIFAILISQQSIHAGGHSWKLAASKKTYICSICTTEVSARPSRITIDAENSMEIAIGEEFTLDVVFSPENSYSPVKWASSSKKVVSVDAGSAIAALKKGIATITVKTANGKKDTVKIRVA